jgi:hypothetical protein
MTSTGRRPAADPTGFPPSRGEGPAQTEHWIVACLASAAVLERVGRPEAARGLREAADQARTRLPTDPDRITTPATTPGQR